MMLTYHQESNDREHNKDDLHRGLFIGKHSKRKEMLVGVPIADYFIKH